MFGSEIAHVETVALGCLVERSSARQPLHYARQLSMEYKLPARAVEPQSLRMMMEIQQQHVSYKTHHKPRRGFYDSFESWSHAERIPFQCIPVRWAIGDSLASAYTR